MALFYVITTETSAAFSQRCQMIRKGMTDVGKIGYNQPKSTLDVWLRGFYSKFQIFQYMSLGILGLKDYLVIWTLKKKGGETY